MTRTPAAPKLSPAMIDAMLHALTSAGHRLYGTEGTNRALTARGYATARPAAISLESGKIRMEYTLTAAGRARGAEIFERAVSTDKATEDMVTDSAAAAARQMLRLGDDESVQIRRAVTTTTPHDFTNGQGLWTPGTCVVRLAGWILEGASVERDADGSTVTVRHLSGSVTVLRRIEPATLPGVVARLGEARPAFADDPANPQRTNVNAVILTMRDREGREVPMSNEPCITRTAARAMLDAWNAEGALTERSSDGSTVTVLRPSGELLTLTAAPAVPGPAWPTTERAVRALMAGLTPGDRVIVRDGGREPVMTVLRALHHPDGTGNPMSYGVTVGYGPGRYNRFIGIDTVVHGSADITLAPADPDTTL